MIFHFKKTLAAFPAVLSFYAGAEELTTSVVQVSASRQEKPLAQALADVSVIDEKTIALRGFLSPVDLLNYESGVQSASVGGRGAGQDLYIRGANSNQSLILIDGMPVNSLDMYGSALRYFSTFDVDRVEVLRGNASSLYGANALGGVVHFITKTPEKDLKIKGLAGYGSNSARQLAASAAGGNDVLRAKLSVNHEATNGFSAQRYASGRDADDDAFKNTGIAAALYLLPNDSDEIGARFRLQRGTVHYDSGNFNGTNTYDDRAHFDHSLWQLFSKNQLTTLWHSTLTLGGMNDNQKSFSAFNQAGDSQVLKRTQLAWQNDVALPLGDLVFLLEYQKEKGEFTTEYTFKNPHNTAAMLGWNAKIDRHAWQIEVRGDHHSAYKNNGTWNAAYAFDLTKEWRARASVGTAFRAPTLYELYAENTAFSMKANPHLKPEKSTNAELGVAWHKGLNELSATYFYNRVKNLIGYVSDPITWVGAYQNTDRAQLNGLSLAWRGQYSGFQTFAHYDFLNAQNRDTGKRLARRARQTFKTGASYDFGKFLAGAEWFLSDARFYDNAEKNRLGGYGLLNLFGEWRFNRFATLDLRLNNVLDKRYELALVGVDTQTGKRYPYNTAGFNAFLSVRINY